MSVEIDIGEPIVAPQFTHAWELEVNYMHGDANGFSSETNFYNDQNELILHLEGLKFMKSLKLGQQEIDENKEKILEFLVEEMQASEEEAEVFVEFYHQLDTTDESYDNDAQIHSIEVYYHDDFGIKFSTKVSVNGVTL